MLLHYQVPSKQKKSSVPEHPVISQDEVDDAKPKFADLAAVGKLAGGELDEDVDHDVVEAATEKLLHSPA